MQTDTVIVVCAGLAFTGAVANVAWRQTCGLSRRRPVCLITDGLSPERRQQLQQAPQLRLQMLRLPGFRALRRFGHLPHQLVWTLRALQALAQQVKPGEPATVICHSHPVAALIGLWFGRRRLRLLMISHGDPRRRPRGSYGPGVLWLYRLCAGPAHRRAAVSVALSPAMAAAIRGHGVDDRRIALIPNGLDPAEIGLQEPPATPSAHWTTRPLRLLFVGRLDAVKGVEVLLDALQLAQRQGAALHLALIALATSRQSRDLRQAIAMRGLSSTVDPLGPRPRGTLAAHYLSCHALVVPSLDDPLPTVVLEAMACGRPVIASAVGGIPFQLQQGDCGLLVPPGDPEALAAAILRLDQDRGLAANLAERALQRSQAFSWQANVQALQAVLEPAADGS